VHPDGAGDAVVVVVIVIVVVVAAADPSLGRNSGSWF